MISVPDAIKAIQDSILPLELVKLNIEDALDQVTHNPINSPIHMPPFAQSAMDGYALNGDNLPSYTLIAEIQAGASAENIHLQHGEAARIFTGAMVPGGTTAIAKQEIVERSNEQITLTTSVKQNENIRPLGEQIKKGEIALNEHTVINAGAAGFLYTLGLHEVEVYRKPKVCIIATGNELVKPGEELPVGKVYESNTYTLKTALKGLNIHADIQTVKDDYASTKESIHKAMTNYDLLITTGGISVGDYDFVGKAFEELGVETLFYKVKQKPGKPVFFGKHASSYVFGLPGNPAAVLSCFYMYVLPAIKTMMGNNQPFLETRKLALKGSYSKTKSLSHFLKARAFGNEVEIMNAQSSAMLSSFATANCLLFMPEGQDEWKSGDLVEAYMLPN
ncbi:MAG: molybdopterin molybdotransferase MoeA [Crocinitomicaceae bacterium]|nr:molybdopterin molybdotransferase MoeA [Crocinitomicaceae bacterium]